MLSRSGIDTITINSENFGEFVWHHDDVTENSISCHIATVANFDIIGTSKVHKRRYILDATFKQFCVKDWRSDLHNYSVATNLAQTDVGYKLGCELSNDGIAEFDDTRLKTYCDSLFCVYAPNKRLSAREYEEEFVSGVACDGDTESFGNIKNISTPKEILELRC